MDAPFHIIADHGDANKFQPYRVAVELRADFWRSPVLNRSILRYLRALALGFKIWRRSVSDRLPGPIVTYGHEHAFVVALLQWLTGFLRRRRTHLMFDLLLEKKRAGLAGLLDRLKMRLFNRVVDGAIVWGPPDINAFASEYNVAEEKFAFVPYHTTVEDFTFDIHDGGYLFAGGNSQRDYRTLIEAAKEIDFPLFIATTRPDVVALAEGQSHITVAPVTPDQFRVKMAGCTAFVQCHERSDLRTVGHQTFLNAMWMGKPVVLADERSAIGYIENGVTGLVTPIADAGRLRDALNRVLTNRELRENLGRAARAEARQPKYRTPNHMRAIYDIALEFDRRRRGLTDPLTIDQS